MHPDEPAIRTMLYERDIDAFLDRDWGQVQDCFDPAVFCGYRGDDPLGWTVGYPTLDSYRDDWLRQAQTFAGEDREPLRSALVNLCRIADVQIAGGRAVVRKEFDGQVQTGAQTHTFAWVTYYFLRQEGSDWLITGFVGGLPLPGREAATLI